MNRLEGQCFLRQKMTLFYRRCGLRLRNLTSGIFFAKIAFLFLLTIIAYASIGMNVFGLGFGRRPDFRKLEFTFSINALQEPTLCALGKPGPLLR